jgi:hypothetical protein
MTFKKDIAPLICVALIGSIFSCNPPSKPDETLFQYVQRNVGDIRQGIYSNDSSTWLIEVVGKTNRKDGREVFITTETQGTGAPDTFYEFVKDGYLITTHLDTIDTTTDTCFTYIPSNPFYEELIAKADPKEGETWIHTRNDDSTFYWAARKVDKFSAICSTFTDVFAFDLFYDNAIILTTYYAKGVDWVGSATHDSTNLNISCCYIKVNGKEIGALRPAKNSTGNYLLKKAILASAKFRFYSDAFGRR